ncbi:MULTISPECIES: WYL domain-containing protein [unclassified Microbispora]|uniref:helix-turn-helix transcriptional regulator n=1 Tax=Microbispora sp. CL1-1 TaxID=2720026 RepID=UPI001F0F8CB9|nr:MULTISPECIES: WYL domain-containing protein [unclassified Microbispora]
MIPSPSHFGQAPSELALNSAAGTHAGPASILQTGRPFSGDELAARLDVSPRTVRRDVDRLREYGYPVETQPGPGGYYRLVAGRTMPPLVLDDDEAIAVLLGLATLASSGSGEDGALDDAATRAYGKLDQFLPARLRPRVAALRASLETGRQLAPAVNAALLAGLAEAIDDREVVRFGYRDRHGGESRRRVEPHRQVHLLLRWYLLGWDLDRDDWRVFRLDRVRDLVRTGVRHAPRALPADAALAYLRQGLNADRRRVRLVVRARPDQVADAEVRGRRDAPWARRRRDPGHRLARLLGMARPRPRPSRRRLHRHRARGLPRCLCRLRPSSPRRLRPPGTTVHVTGPSGLPAARTRAISGPWRSPYGWPS